MTTTNLRVLYWIFTGLFAVWLIADGMGGILHAQAGIDSLVALGYPVYLLTLSGIAKVLGAVAILQNTFRTIKEWAYAGYAFNCLLAFASQLSVGASLVLIIMPIVFLLFMFVSYYFWKRTT